jgi:subtilisin family serine protease
VIQDQGADSAINPPGPKASLHGPRRNDPAQGIPKHAYSPFDKLNQPQPVEPVAGRDFQPGQLVIKFRPQVQVRRSSTGGAARASVGKLTDSPDLNRILSEQGITGLEPVFPEPEAALQRAGAVPKDERGLSRWYRAETKQALKDTVDRLLTDPGVEAAEPDFLRKLAGTAPEAVAPSGPEPGQAARTGNPALRKMDGPSDTPPNVSTDPLFSQQWHLSAAKVTDAWSYLQSQGLPPGGSRDVVVAVIDSGVDLNHPDFAANLWTNSREIAGNGIDDDGNGYVDDVHGIDAITRTGNPMDDHGHGTHVAGIVAAQGHNNAGGVGVAYNVQVMPIKAAQYSGVLASSDIARAINYAVAQGADVINMSFGGYNRSQIEGDALAVAFGQCVLVAAAGNDSHSNEAACLGAPMYPAAYNWVLGVMASTTGGDLADFSNSDCIPHNSIEYELMAPGVDVMSTLPDGQYAAWDGTSMAAPVVSGIAALVRTKYADKDVYSSRFIMGQIAANAAPVADAFKALTVPPKPELSYLEHWLFDTTAQAANNDDDGIVDSGETVDLAIVIRNHWGKADQVTAKLEAYAEGAFQPDPYVTWITDTVDYGAVGSFNSDDNGLIHDAQQTITGVQHPFRFQVSSSCPNDHLIPLKLKLTCRNGLDAGDTATYTSVSQFFLIVQRGRELPRIISSDMTLTKDYYWLVPDATLVESGVTFRATEGTQIQFGGITPNDPYNEGVEPLIQANGTVILQGSASEPIELFASAFAADSRARLRNIAGGSIHLSYTRMLNPELVSSSAADHCWFGQDKSEFGGVPWICVQADNISKTVFSKLGSTVFPLTLYCGNIKKENLFDNCYLNGAGALHYSSSAFLKNVKLLSSQWGDRTYLSSVIILDGYVSESGRDNAFLNLWWDPDISHWMRFTTGGEGQPSVLQSNYWGTLSRTLIRAAISDHEDDFNRRHCIYEPILTDPPVTCYPFVADVQISTGGQENTSKVGAEPIVFRVIFNRDMDPSVQPQVSFGPDIPYTDYTARKVEGGWHDARTWVGTFNVTPVTGDGYQYIRVAGAVAAEDPWLVTGDDSERFRFEIITSGTESMNLQATGGEGKVSISWMQDDFEMLAGYNLYRSPNPSNNFARLNGAIIPVSQRTWQDTAVTPGQAYYYKFTVVKTDMSESDFSNLAAGTPLDTIPPVITHNPVTSAAPGLPLTLFADVTDNVSVQSVSLQFREIGETVYASRSMTRTTGSRHSATLEGSRITLAGLEYYLEASDGVTTARFGRPELPFQVTVENRPVVTAVSPVRGPASGRTAMVLSGANFQPGARVRFGAMPADSVVVDSPNRITCTTPAHFPAAVDVTVQNADNTQGSLLRGFTFYSDVATLALPNTGGLAQSVVSVPVTGVGLSGLAAADLTIGYSASLLQMKQVRLGNLTAGWTLEANATPPGQLRLALSASTGPVEGSGVLATIDFEVLGPAGASCPLQFTAVKLNAGAILAQTEDGFFLADSVYSLGGTVRYWSGSIPVPNTALTANGERQYRAVSGSDGGFSVGGLARGAYTLKPSKTDGANQITAYDAALVLKHAVGLMTLTGQSARAADVDKSSTIDSMDAFYILQKSVGLIDVPFPGAGTVWEFEPAERAYQDLTTAQTGQDFTAVLLGDVSGNWSTATGASPSLTLLSRRVTGPTAYVLVATDTVSNPSTSETDVSVRVRSETASINGLDLRLGYSATTYVKSADSGTLAADASLAVNTSSAGLVQAGLASANPMATDGVALQVRLMGTGDAAAQVLSAVANEGALVTTIALREFRLSTTSGVAGGLVSLPVEFVSQGNENAIGFSLAFDPAVLTFVEASAASAETILQVNDQDASLGRVGIALALPTGSAFTAGAHQVALASFRAASVAAEGWTTVAFGDQPVKREVSDAQGVELGVNTEGGGVALVSGYEADVAPRAGVNGTVTVSDWVQVGRFAAGLDFPTEGGEFQRADCAPRMLNATLVGGNGQITVSDWVQAGRYAAGLDPATPVAGPTAPASSGLSSVSWPAADTVLVSIGSVTASPGEEVEVPVTLKSSGWVAGLGFSMAFDNRQLRFLRARAATASERISLLVNDAELDDGRIGLALAGMGPTMLPSDSSIVLNLRFAVLTGAAARAQLNFDDRPVPREVVDGMARVIPSEFRSGTFAIMAEASVPGAAILSIAQEADVVVLSWAAASGEAVIQWTPSLTNPQWQAVDQPVETQDGRTTLRVRPDSSQRYYRVVRSR